MTQFCFESGPILGWIGELNRRDIRLPVIVGLAGPATTATLMKFALRCGIGNSMRAVRSQIGRFGRLLTDAGPDEVMRGLQSAPEAATASIAGFHLFPFGGLRKAGNGCAASVRRHVGKRSKPRPRPASTRLDHHHGATRPSDIDAAEILTCGKCLHQRWNFSRMLRWPHWMRLHVVADIDSAGPQQRERLVETCLLAPPSAKSRSRELGRSRRMTAASNYVNNGIGRSAARSGRQCAAAAPKPAI